MNPKKNNPYVAIAANLLHTLGKQEKGRGARPLCTTIWLDPSLLLIVLLEAFLECNTSVTTDLHQVAYQRRNLSSRKSEQLGSPLDELVEKLSGRLL